MFENLCNNILKNKNFEFCCFLKPGTAYFTAIEQREKSWIHFNTWAREGPFSSSDICLYCMMRGYEPLGHILSKLIHLSRSVSLFNHNNIRGASTVCQLIHPFHLLNEAIQIDFLKKLNVFI